ncbi:GntR family transcriptional regulator [Streptantibioticus ferralitis]|uniref:GntR family transcriptional regulator n=1 Tax=Streptantibioticus ferralitis TaxID=236510 RepID=A0ABT5Z9P5_9ACTN|nr:GntR family transcriptional regulator [Streptantibioticus ferralitis]MDF2260540.1 GntR family transcriptional regulator [Streptantibioticus ferralitis]
MDSGITRPQPMYLQLAGRIAQAIQQGDLEAGSTLPSESEMVSTYRVSPATVRAAVNELRNMGLVIKAQGRRTTVKGSPAARAIPRTVSRTGTRYELPEMKETEAPAISRVTLTGTPAELLNQQGQQAISVDRLLRDPLTGERLTHRMLIPLQVAADVPALATTPDAPVPELYKHLTTAGFTIVWDEEVGAMMPTPDERMALGLTDPQPLLVSYRVTLDEATQRPLLVEELRVSAATTRLSYRVTPVKAPTKRRPAKAAE